MNTLLDRLETVAKRYDELTHTWFDKASKPISQIKMM